MPLWCRMVSPQAQRHQRGDYPGILVEGLGPLFIHIVYYFSGSSSLSLHVENYHFPLDNKRQCVPTERVLILFCREWKITIEGGGGGGSCPGGTGCVLKQGDAMIR